MIQSIRITKNNITNIKLWCLCILTASLIHCACNSRQNYENQYTIKVIYSNNSIDTIEHIRKSFDGNTVRLGTVESYIKTQKGRMKSDSTGGPCLVSICNQDVETIAYNIKTYKVIKLEKIPINDR